MAELIYREIYSPFHRGGAVTCYLSDLPCEPPPPWASGYLSPLHQPRSRSRVGRSDALDPSGRTPIPASPGSCHSSRCPLGLSFLQPVMGRQKCYPLLFEPSIPSRASPTHPSRDSHRSRVGPSRQAGDYPGRRRPSVARD